MKVAIGSETTGFALKEAVKKHLTGLGYEVLDVGCQDPADGTLYFESSAAVARLIQKGEVEKGIVICGSGGGASLVANAYKGVHCIACESIYTAERIGLINNANCLAMGEQIVTPVMGCQMAEKYLAGKWCDGFAPQRKKNNERGYEVMCTIEEKGDF